MTAPQGDASGIHPPGPPPLNAPYPYQPPQYGRPPYQAPYPYPPPPYQQQYPPMPPGGYHYPPQQGDGRRGYDGRDYRRGGDRKRDSRRGGDRSYHDDKYSDNKDPIHTIFLHNILFDLRPEELEEFAKSYGEYVNIYSLVSKKGIAFITYFDIRDAIRAVTEGNERLLGGRPVLTAYAYKPPSHSKRDPRDSCSTLLVKSGTAESKLDVDSVRNAFSSCGEMRGAETRHAPGEFVVKFFNIKAARTAVDMGTIEIKGEKCMISYLPDDDEGEENPQSTPPHKEHRQPPPPPPPSYPPSYPMAYPPQAGVYPPPPPMYTPPPAPQAQPYGQYMAAPPQSYPAPPQPQSMNQPPPQQMNQQQQNHPMMPNQQMNHMNSSIGGQGLMPPPPPPQQTSGIQPPQQNFQPYIPQQQQQQPQQTMQQLNANQETLQQLDLLFKSDQ